MQFASLCLPLYLLTPVTWAVALPADTVPDILDPSINGTDVAANDWRYRPGLDYRGWLLDNLNRKQHPSMFVFTPTLMAPAYQITATMQP
jgi:hypothetical protein